MSTGSRTGSSGAVEAGSRVVRDEKGAIVTEREWLGMLDEVQAIADTLDTPYRLEPYRGPIFRLTTSTPGNTLAPGGAPPPNEQIVTVWELKPTQQRRDYWELPAVASELAKITDDEERSFYLKQVRAFSAGETDFYVTDSHGNLGWSGKIYDYLIRQAVADVLNMDVIRAFLADLAQGVDSYMHNSFALSKKRVGPAAADNLVVDYVLTNGVVRTSTLLAQEPSIPRAIRSPLVNALSEGGWIRQADELSQLDAARIEIHSQWIYAPRFSQLIYGEAV